jgi:hypothetical protein
MWESWEAQNPGNADAAARFFAEALENARIRYGRNRDSTHQYDLIASFLALKSFISNLGFSAPVAAATPTLREIAAWHEKLCRRAAGLEDIKKEAIYRDYEKKALARIYIVEWNEIEKIARADAAMAFQGSLRFKKSVQREKERDYILQELRLSPAELMLSANRYAGKIETLRLQDPETNLLLIQHLKDCEVFLKTARPGEKDADKLRHEVSFLKQRLEAAKSHP